MKNFFRSVGRTVFSASPGSGPGILVAADVLKLILTWLATHAAALTFLGPWGALVAGLAALILQAISLLHQSGPVVPARPTDDASPFGAATRAL